VAVTGPAAGDAVARVFREEHGRVIATLIRVLGDFDLAEEAVASYPSLNTR
jgi:RNA polymerase sigma-70 factor (ECF subfamily)